MIWIPRTHTQKRIQVQTEDEILRFGFNSLQLLEALFLMFMTEIVD